MNPPTHETVAQRAREIWHQRGCPTGADTEIWLEAERQLGETLGPADTADHAVTADRIRKETAAESMVENHISPAIPDDAAIKAAMQKKSAREPIVPHTKAPKAKPPESGKPLWSHPHSSSV